MGSAVSCTSLARVPERGRRSNRVRPLDIISSSSSLGSSGRYSFARLASLVPASDEERWQFIDLTCQQEAKPVEEDHTRDWKTLRLFVSSTFTDFQAEREVLASQVFPELQEWCETRRFHLVTTDLQWGLENEIKTKERLEASLHEIERCREDGSCFFFLALLSEMAGWIPTPSNMAEVAGRFGCIQGMSMQEMEIVSAVYRDQNPNAGFFLRDPGSLVGLPEVAKDIFVCQSSQKRLQLLKHKLREKFPDQVKTYKCWVLKSAETLAEGQVTMQGLDCFSRDVTQYCKDRIESQFPMHSKPFPGRLPVSSRVSQLQEMNDYQQRVLESKALHQCFGQNQVEKQILGYISGRGAGNPLVLAGEVGEGKSNILARCIMQLSQSSGDHGRPSAPTGLGFVGRQNWKLFYHFVGSVPGSRNLRKLLWRLWHFESLVGTNNGQMPKDINVLARNINLLLSKGSSDRVALFIDHLDMLEDGQHAHELKWLPAKLPDNVRVVISVQRKSACYKILHNRQPVPVEVFPNYQGKSGAPDVIHAVLRRHDLWLNEEQLKILAQKPGSSNIMYLTEACRELLQYPKEEIDDVLLYLPVNLPSLIDKLLSDCETCHGGRLVIGALCLMACARNGLLETEMLDMLGSLAACSSSSGRSLSETDMQNVPHELVEKCGMTIIAGGALPFMMEPVTSWERISGWEGSTDDMITSHVSIIAEGVAPTVDHDGGDSGIGTNSGSDCRKVSGLGPEINFSSKRRLSGSSVGSQGRLLTWNPHRRGSYGGGLCSGSSGSSLNQPPLRRSSLNGLSQLSIADHSSEGDISSLGSDRRASAKTRRQQQSMFSPHPALTPRLLSAQWVHVYAGLYQLLEKSGSPGEGRLNFSHLAVRETVVSRYFHKPISPCFPFTFCTSSQFYGADQPTTGCRPNSMLKSVSNHGLTPPLSQDSEAGSHTHADEQKRALREIVNRRFAWWHARLANYFESSTDLDRRAEELPYHLIRVGDWGRLARCLSDWEIFDRLSTDENVMDLLYYWRFAGGPKAAVVRYNGALETYASSHDVTDKELTRRRQQVARVLSMMGETEEARKLLCEALEAEEQLLGSDPQRVADLTVEIAELLSSHLKKSEYETGCLSNANGDQQVIEYVRRSIEFRRQLCEEESENSEDIVMTRRELAKALRLLSFHLMSQAVGTSGGQLAKEGTLLEARKSIQECTEIYESLGDSGSHIESMLSLAITYNDSPRQMLECYEEAHRLCNRTYGHRHETAARIHLNLALLYDCQLGKPAVALSHYKRWLLVNEQVLGHDHPKSIQARDAVVRHLRQMGKDKDAERFQQKGVC